MGEGGREAREERVVEVVFEVLFVLGGNKLGFDPLFCGRFEGDIILCADSGAFVLEFVVL